MINLELVPTHELAIELVNRYDSAVLIGLAESQETESSLYLVGNRFACMGLLATANRILIREVQSTCRQHDNKSNDDSNERENDGTW